MRAGIRGKGRNVGGWVFNGRMTVSLGFTEADIKVAAGDKSFKRGLDYVEDVEDLEIAGTQITASVWGSGEYRVCLSAGEAGLRGECTCPYGREGFFCKHCVAVGLAVLQMNTELIEEAQTEWRTLESWLKSLSKKALLAELIRLLDEDPELRQRLELRAAVLNQDAGAVWHAIEDLVRVPWGDWIESSQDYANDVHKAAAAIEDLIRGGGAENAIWIAEEAIDLVAEAFRSADDSSGAVRDAAYELLAAHLHACRAAPLDPVELGEYLAGLVFGNDHIWPDLADYADLLGEPGFAAVRDRIAAAYAENPESWRARSLMEAVAKAEGDVEALVTVYAAQLDEYGRNHLRIVQALDEAGRGEEALGWAERGLREVAHPDQRLVDYLAGRYAAAGRDDDVLALRRDRFRAERTLASYQALRQAATRSGGWPAERSQALDLLRQDARAARRWTLWDRGGPVLIDALTDDGDLDAAWAAAKDPANHATDDQWLRLADAWAATRPADALDVYLRVIGALKKETGDKVYRRMAALLLAARGCHQALGTTDQFRRYLTLLRMECKRKRNLMKILDENGL
jgi:uncharacterized Zn finger protein